MGPMAYDARVALQHFNIRVQQYIADEHESKYRSSCGTYMIWIYYTSDTYKSQMCG